jgi:hypothetical protein
MSATGDGNEDVFTCIRGAKWLGVHVCLEFGSFELGDNNTRTKKYTSIVKKYWKKKKKYCCNKYWN